MSESREIKTTVTVNEEGQIAIETNIPALETALLLQEGATYLLRQARQVEPHDADHFVEEA